MQNVVFADMVDADPAPRELTTTARRYIAGQATYLWAGLAVVFLFLPNVMMAALVKKGVVFSSLAFASLVTAALVAYAVLARRRLRTILVHGEQRPAQIVQMHQLHVRSGLARGRRDTIWLDVDGRRVKCSSWAGDLEGAEPHAWIRVLVHPGFPEHAIPVVSVT